MAFKLTKAQIEELAEHRTYLTAQRQAIAVEFALLKKALDQIVRPLNGMIRGYNARVAQANALIEAIGEEHRDTFDEKSETWKEGDRGLAAADFIEAFENVEIDEVDEIALLVPDPPEFSGLQDLAELPEEADS